MNEEQVGTVMAYFEEVKDQKQSRAQPQYRSMNMGHTQTQGQVINAYNVQSTNTFGQSNGQMSFNQNVINDGVRRQLYQQQSSEAVLSNGLIGSMGQDSVENTMSAQQPNMIHTDDNLQRQTMMQQTHDERDE